MALTGRQKAAILLTMLDPGTAAELLKGLPSESIKELGMELVKIDTGSGSNNKEQTKVALEFFDRLQQRRSEGVNIKGFLGEMLVSILGKDKAEQIQTQIKQATEKQDPFMLIRSAGTEELVSALKGEHHQTVAVVLSELPAKKSQEVLSQLDEQTRLRAVCKMTNLELIGPEVKQRIAAMVCERLKAVRGEIIPQGRQQTLRKLAVVLSGLDKELRDRLLEEINKSDKETCATVKNLMITWDDILIVADRSLQEAIRSVEARTLATALRGADAEIVKKIRSNISERAAAMLDEETSLMQEPTEKEILDAREEVIKPLREANDKGTLRFVRQ